MAIVVRVASGQMEAIVEVERVSDEPLQVDVLKRALADAAVTHGIDDEACNDLITAINKAPPGARLSGTLARGTPPVHGTDGRLEMAVDYSRNRVGTLDNSGTIDFHNRGTFTPITPGQLIARIVPPTPAIPGSNVHGKPINANLGIRTRVSAGQGTRVEAGGTELRATREGALRRAGELIEVMDMIRVPGNVDYSVGNIDCAGPVRIEGDVMPGFHVRAGGDVWIGGVVDNAEVTSTGAITIVQGILGRSRICAGRGIKAGYVRDAYLESDASIFIQKEALNSTVVCGDTIVIAEGGRIVGGKLFAKQRIETGVAGHEKGIPTTLAVGVNPLEELRAARLKADMDQARGVQKQVCRIREIAKPGRYGILDQLLAHAEKKHARSADELAQMDRDMAQTAECRINVRNAIHPGVRIRIGTENLTIEDDLPGATFQYDIESGQLVQVQI